MLKKSKKGKDLGFGFNEEGYPLQDKYRFNDISIHIENKKGSVRKWYDPHNKKSGSTKMRYDYGYIKNAVGSDDEPIDVYVGPNEDAKFVYVVHQNKAPKFNKYDEDKVMLGFRSEEDAKKAYLKQYNDERFYGGMSSMPFKTFKKKIKDDGKITNESLIIIEKRTNKELSKSGLKRKRDKQKGLREANADKIGIILGTFQPFHLGHAEMIRTLTSRFDKIIILVLTSQDRNDNLSFNIIGELIKKSLPDVIRKVEVNQVRDDKNISQLLSDLVNNGNSSFGSKTAATILAGQNRAADVQGQIEKVRNDENKSISFDPNVITVERINSIKNDDVTGNVSAAKVRKEIGNNNEDAVKRMLDPHLISNKTDFEDIYAKMKKELNTKIENILFGVLENVLDESGVMDANGFGSNVVGPKTGSSAWSSGTKNMLSGSEEIWQNQLLRLPKVNDENNELNETLNAIGGEKNVYKILKFNAKPLLSKGINIKKLNKLGASTDGVAYDMGNNKVLKITTDTQEAMASNSIKGRTDLEYVVNIHDVFKFVNTLGESSPIYGIITEKLIPIKGREKTEFDIYMGEIITRIGAIKFTNIMKNGDWDGLLKSLYTSFEEDTNDDPQFSELPTGHPNLALIPKVAKSITENYTAFLKHYNIDKIMSDLKKAGIGFADYHSGNIMKRENTFVINDLGRSDVQLNKEPAKLEGVIYEALSNIGGVTAINNILDANADKLLKKDVIVSILQMLGYGEWGVAYDIGNGKVLKITADKKEAIASNSIKERTDLTNVVNIYDVFRLPNTLGQLEPIYGIITEKLNSLTETEQRDVNECFNDIESYMGRGKFERFMDEGDWNNLIRELEECIKDDVEILYNMYGDTPYHDKIISDRMNKYVKTLEKFNIPSMMLDLKKAGIRFHDYHGNNIMRRKDKFVINDLGQSSAARHIEPPVLEKIIRETLEELGGESGAWNALLLNKKKLKDSKWKIDVKNIKALGSGVEGVAYDIGNNRVLKITTDKQEALASNNIKGKMLDNVVHIYDVFKLDDVSGIEIFGIVEEKLLSLNSSEIRRFDEIITDLEGLFGEEKSNDILKTGDWNKLISDMKKELALEIEKESGCSISNERNKKILDKRIKDYVEELEHFNMPNIMSDLKNIGIGFYDYHGHNLMKRGTKFVINDLGRSEVNQTRELDKL